MRAERARFGLPRRGAGIRLAGEAAHGLILTGYVLAEAALIDRKVVAHAPTLGREARGPFCGGTLRIGGEPEEDPCVDEADYLLLTSAAAVERFGGTMAADGLLIAEESLPELPAHGVALPLVATASEAGGTPLLVDLVSAAALAEIADVVTRRALREAARRLLPERTRKAGFAALDAGWMLARRRPRV